MFCKNCGSQISDTQSFCSRCGAKVRETTAPAPAAFPAPAAPAAGKAPAGGGLKIHMGKSGAAAPVKPDPDSAFTLRSDPAEALKTPAKPAYHEMWADPAEAFTTKPTTVDPLKLSADPVEAFAERPKPVKPVDTRPDPSVFTRTEPVVSAPGRPGPAAGGEKAGLLAKFKGLGKGARIGILGGAAALVVAVVVIVIVLAVGGNKLEGSYHLSAFITEDGTYGEGTPEYNEALSMLVLLRTIAGQSGAGDFRVEIRGDGTAVFPARAGTATWTRNGNQVDLRYPDGEIIHMTYEDGKLYLPDNGFDNGNTDPSGSYYSSEEPSDEYPIYVFSK